MEVICLEDAAFYALIDRVFARIKEQNNIKEDKWIDGDEAMRMLRITSKTTLQKYRDEGQIRHSKINGRVIFYDIDSIREFLANNSEETF